MAIVAGVAVVVATAAWRGLDALSEHRPSLTLATILEPAHPAPDASKGATARALRSRTRLSDQRTTPGAKVAPHALDDAITVEVCGYGPVTLPPDDPDPLQQLPRAVRGDALDKVRAEMMSSRDPQTRAAALLIALRSRRGDAGQSADMLARLATGSKDPAVYAMALEGCRGFASDAGGTCSSLSRAHWARLDPDNALSWLELGAEAHERGESKAESEAMRRAARARRIDGYEERLPALVDRTLAGTAPSLRHVMALDASLTAQTMWSASRSHRAYEYCTSDPGADVRRRGCEAIAETLVRRGLGANDRRIGVAIGRHLGWAEQRLHAMQQPDSTRGDGLAELPTLGFDLSCDGVSRIERWLRQRAYSQPPTKRGVAFDSAPSRRRPEK